MSKDFVKTSFLSVPGTNLTFYELLDSLQRGTLLSKINVGPKQIRGDFIPRYTER